MTVDVNCLLISIGYGIILPSLLSNMTFSKEPYNLMYSLSISRTSKDGFFDSINLMTISLSNFHAFFLTTFLFFPFISLLDSTNSPQSLLSYCSLKTSYRYSLAGSILVFSRSTSSSSP